MPGTGWTSRCWTSSRPGRAGWSGCTATTTTGVLRERLPEVARAEIDGLHIAVVHETGDRTGREERCAARFPDVDVLVFGHSHIPWDTTAPGGLRLLNPGSPTDRRRQPHGTFVTAVVRRAAARTSPSTPFRRG